MDKSAELSLGKRRTVLGYEIKQLPLGRYLEMEGVLVDFGRTMLDVSFPGMEPGEILTRLAGLDKDGLMNVIKGAAFAAPEYALRLVSRFSGIDEETLKSDENIGLYGLARIIGAIAEVNRLGETLNAARGLIRPPAPAGDGSRG